MAAVHTHNWALGALVELVGRSKADLAREAQVTPQELSDLIAGRLAGTGSAKRSRVAAAIGVDVKAITCWCDDRSRHKGEGTA